MYQLWVPRRRDLCKKLRMKSSIYLQKHKLCSFILQIFTDYQACFYQRENSSGQWKHYISCSYNLYLISLTEEKQLLFI